MSLDKHRRYTNLTTHVISQDNLSSVQVGNCIIFLVHSSKMMFFFFTDICCWIMELIKPSLILDAATLKLNLPKAGAGLMELLWNWHNDEKVFETRNIKHFSLRWTRGLQQTRPRWRSRSGWDPASRAPRSTWRGLSGMRLMQVGFLIQFLSLTSSYSIFASLMGWVLQAICLLGGIDLTWGMGIDLSWAII